MRGQQIKQLKEYAGLLVPVYDPASAQAASALAQLAASCLAHYSAHPLGDPNLETPQITTQPAPGTIPAKEVPLNGGF